MVDAGVSFGVSINVTPLLILASTFCFRIAAVNYDSTFDRKQLLMSGMTAAFTYSNTDAEASLSNNLEDFGILCPVALVEGGGSMV